MKKISHDLIQKDICSLLGTGRSRWRFSQLMDTNCTKR